MGKPARVPLSAFARENPSSKPGLPCWACSIKEAEEINAARREGTAITVIRRWLIEECGFTEVEAGVGRLSHHFSANRHHEREARLNGKAPAAR